MAMRKIALSLASIGAASLLVTGASFALFTASTTNANNVFASGTVRIGELTGCSNTFNNIAPGDSGDFTCNVTYTGSLDAWLGLTTTFSGDLTTCDAPNSLGVTVKSGAQTFGNNAADQVVGTAPVSGGTTKSFDVHWELPLAADNDCQAKSATLTLQVRAVQSRNNSKLPGAPGYPGPVDWS
jgi:predicted ribosomally synthesized peptide with SipW-like signal peptide